MRVCLISYATPEFYNNQNILNNSASSFGIGKIYSYKKKDIKNTAFYRDNRFLLEQKRGAGYWVWKPYLILRTMDLMNQGDIIIYADCSVEIICDLTPLTDLCLAQNGILLFRNHGLVNKDWTKRDCFILMGCDSEEYHNAEISMATFCMFEKNERSLTFLNEWLHYVTKPEIVSDSQNTCGLPDLPGFKAHRHDQSVLSILSIKHKIKTFRDPSKQGNYMKMQAFRDPGEFIAVPYSETPFLNSPYPTLITINRDRRNGIIKKLLFRIINKISR